MDSTRGMETLLIGFGNVLRRDDGVGWAAVERLAGKRIRGVACHQLTPDLAAEIARADRVIFVDAAAEGIAGELFCRRVAAAPSTDLVHAQTPAALMELTRKLYGCSPPAFLYTIAGAEFGYGEGLSSEVESTLVELIERLVIEAEAE